MTSGVDKASIGRGEAYRIGEGGCPTKRLQPGPGTTSAIDRRPSDVAESAVPLSSPCDAWICLLPESLRPVFRHIRIVAESAACLLSSKVSIPVVILCDRTSHLGWQQTFELGGDGL